MGTRKRTPKDHQATHQAKEPRVANKERGGGNNNPYGKRKFTTKRLSNILMSFFKAGKKDQKEGRKKTGKLGEHTG